jgi:drug/metabolite transporter (DMT)-like permease
MKAYHLILAATMMITGSINTITTKFADIQCAKGKVGYFTTPSKGSKCFNATNADCINPTFAQQNGCSFMNRTVLGNVNSINETSAPEWVQKLWTESHENETTFEGICNDNECGVYWKPGSKLKHKPGTEGYHQFDHPFVQSLTMFIGELLCLVVFKMLFFYKHFTGKPQGDIGPQTFSPFWWAIPALCDSVGTTTMYIGLTLTYASSFQMLRGAVVIFTGLASKWFLKKVLVAYHWAGMIVVLLGLTSVGGAAFMGSSASSGDMPHQVLGDALIIGAQVIVAVQMVVEEKLMEKCQTPPLQAVGWEGFFGCIYMGIFCVAFYHLNGPRGGRFEEAYDAWDQIQSDRGVLLALLGTICSIATFNWSGLSVTKEMSATTRMVLDSLRTIIIWVFGLIAVDAHTGKKNHWEKFDPAGPGYLQILGFILLLIGSALYNERDIVPGLKGGPKEPLIYPLFRKMGLGFAKLSADMDERTSLLKSETIQGGGN